MNKPQISYLTDENGRKSSVVLPIKMFKENSFEDLYDVILAEGIINEKTYKNL